MERERIPCPQSCLETCDDVARPLAEAGVSFEQIQKLFGLVGERLGVVVECDGAPVPSKYFDGTYCPIYRYPHAVYMLQGAAVAEALHNGVEQPSESE